MLDRLILSTLFNFEFSRLSFAPDRPHTQSVSVVVQFLEPASDVSHLIIDECG